MFESVVIKSEAQVQCCLPRLDGYRFINVFCINLAFISQPFCMSFQGPTLFCFGVFCFILKAIVILGNMVTKVHFTRYIYLYSSYLTADDTTQP